MNRDEQGSSPDVGSGKGEGAGESGGGAYPNPNGGKGSGTGPDSFMGHGGQSDNAYQGGGDDEAGEDNPNAPTD